MTAAAQLAATPDTFPWLGWPRVAQYVDRIWDPENSPHHSIVGLTGSGKSYLAVNGILRPLCAWDRVLIVDTKGDDEIVSKQGKAVHALQPERVWRDVTRRREPFDRWQRLVVSDDKEHARHQVSHALKQVYEQGDWVVYLDEIRDITDPHRETGLRMLPLVDRIYRKGRSRHVSLIAATQAPRWCPSSFYDQASFAWIGRIRDRVRQKRLLEIGGMSNDALPIVGQLQRREWLLSADNGEFFARTKVTT